MSIGYFFIIYEEWDDVQIKRNEKEQKKKKVLLNTIQCKVALE